MCRPANCASVRYMETWSGQVAAGDSIAVADAIEWRQYPPVQLSPILAVALEQIVRQGYDAVTVRTIAKQVGVTVPSLYYHFENKQAILVALLDHAMTIVRSHVEAALAEAGDDPVRRVENLVEAVALYMSYHSDLAFLDSERRSLEADGLSRYLAHRDWVDTQLQDAIDGGCRAGSFGTPTPSTARRAILAMCQGIAGWYKAGGQLSPEETAQQYTRIALAAVEYRA